MLTRRTALGTLAALPFAAPLAAFAHHGWRWTTGENVELRGVIVEARLGNPHGLVTVDADGDIWTVEVGQPWRNERAGLTNDDFAAGREIMAEGEPSANIEDRRLKAERLWFDGVKHELYPERS